MGQFYFVAQSNDLPDGFVKDTEHYYRQQLHLTPPMPFCREIMAFLFAQKIPYAIVSNKRREFIESIIKQHDFMSSCSLIVALEDVKEAKPSPQGLLMASEHLAKPVLFVGDTLVDIEAAKRADIDMALLSEEVNSDATYRITSLLQIMTLMKANKLHEMLAMIKADPFRKWQVTLQFIHSFLR